MSLGSLTMKNMKEHVYIHNEDQQIQNPCSFQVSIGDSFFKTDYQHFWLNHLR